MMFKGQINICHCLRFNSLGRIHQKNRPFTGS